MAIDFSDLGAQPANSQPIDFSDLGGQPISPSTGGSNQLDVAKFALGQVAGLNPVNKLIQARQNIGGKIAEAGGYLGGKVATGGNILGAKIPALPTAGNIIQGAGVALGSVPAIGPEALSAYTSLAGLYNPTNPVGVGLTNLPKDLSPQYAAQNQAIGISGEVPETASKVQYENPMQYPSQLSNVRYSKEGMPISTGAKMPNPRPLVPAEPLPSSVPTKYPDDPGALINQANSRIAQHGTNLTPQELSDYHDLISTKISSGDIPKFDPNGKITPLFAKASETQKNITDTLNQVAEPLLKNAQLPQGTFPTRAGLNQAYGIASKQQGTLNLLKKYGLKAGEAGIGALGVKGLYDYFRR